MARLIINLTSADISVDGDAFNKHYMQSVIYSRFNQEDEKDFHASNDFRFFSFSDFFPSGGMNKGEQKKIIVSSPDRKKIAILAKSFAEDDQIYLGANKFRILSIKTFNLNFAPKSYISGSPVVLYSDNKKGRFFSLKEGDSISFFMERIKENAIKKYTQFSGKSPRYLEGPLFDSVRLKKEVSVKINHRGGDFYIIGSLWERLGIIKGRKIDFDFYKFILDCGIGEKNSLGFGFINPVMEERNHAAR